MNWMQEGWQFRKPLLPDSLNCFFNKFLQQGIKPLTSLKPVSRYWVLTRTGELEPQLLGGYHLLPLSSLLILIQKDQEVCLMSQDLDGFQYTRYIITKHQQGNKNLCFSIITTSRSLRKNILAKFLGPF